MNTSKVLVGGIVGGIVYLILGWLTYGMLLMDFMSSNNLPGIMKSEDQLVWWALIAANFMWGILVSYVLNSVGNITSSSKGAGVAATTALLVSAAYDLGLYATENVTTLKATAVDVIAITIMSAIVGAIIVMVSRKIK